MALESNEKARRQWVADISHELRTPLAVLRGEIEALLEGVRQTTPGAVRSLHNEVLRLNRLVDDLYQLALSDLGALTYRKEEVDLREVLENAANSYRPEFERKSLTLSLNVPDEEIILFADRERLVQLFSNLLDNSLRYTDPGGVVSIRLNSGKDMVTAQIEDSAPAVPPEAMDKLFDRLYRAEGSRNRRSGGAGLGLAICKNIVEAHGGSIFAVLGKLGGLLVNITFPANGTTL
jgi:two-component system, OmpR family, sensor histidine kinase BaeS